VARPFIEKWLIEAADAVTPVPEIRAAAEKWLAYNCVTSDSDPCPRLFLCL